MRINWNELDAVKISEPHMKVLFQIMDTEDAKQLFAHMEKYAMLPEEVQCALGYMRCLLESGMGGFYSAYDKYSVDMLRYTFGHVPFMRLPIRFIGWGGEHNEIGPAYEIDGRCQISKNSKLFYTDDDIQESADEAGELARYIVQASSGIVDVRAEQLDQLRTMNSDMKGPYWCVTFRLDNAAFKQIAVNGKTVKPEEGKAHFILPKAGEFDCMIGEIVNGDPDNVFILAKHNYCMK